MSGVRVLPGRPVEREAGISGGVHILAFAGSTPALSTKFQGLIVQLEECRSYKAEVVGSNPTQATIPFGVRLTARREALTLEIAVRIRGAEP